MKTILRTLGRTGLILVAAFIVVVITMTVAPQGSASGARPQRNAGAQQAGQAPQDGGPPGGFDGERDSGGAGLFGIFEVVQSFAIISAIVAVYVLAVRVTQRRRLE